MTPREVGRPPASGVGLGPGGWRLGVPEEFYFLAHERDRPCLHPRVLGAGLAAAIVADAVLAGWLLVRDGLVTAVDRRPGAVPTTSASASAGLSASALIPPIAAGAGSGETDPDGELIRWVWDWVVSEPHRYPVGTWVRALSPQATTRVSERLVAAGYLTSGSAWRGHRPMSADVNAAAWPAARLSQRLDKQQPVTDADAVVLAIMEAAGASRVLLRYATPVAATHLAAVLADLHHERPEVAALVEQVRVVIDTGTLTRT